ncbi:META domain-containing protein [Sphingomicrobium sediminis]|uniref:META domain-containing protein n=1 Tax=Sphingomicrobium sediminis TaxID=2950949 RepID=A0A9X2EHD9_9SPHN|nr:META domain-containing protein [Sphingomicrobium sediminis]MCM8557615.1 META domain-containing protein [Sphingomicrobium sediminis]
MKRFLFPVALATAALGGCAGLDIPTDPLTANQWHLVAIERPSQPTVNLSGRAQDSHWIRFRQGGDFNASLDCNTGNGDWYRPGSGASGAREGLLEIGEIASTRALCPSPSYGEEMAAALPLATAYEIYDNDRTLVVRTRTASYRFTAR